MFLLSPPISLVPSALARLHRRTGRPRTSLVLLVQSNHSLFLSPSLPRPTTCPIVPVVRTGTLVARTMSSPSCFIIVRYAHLHVYEGYISNERELFYPRSRARYRPRALCTSQFSARPTQTHHGYAAHLLRTHHGSLVFSVRIYLRGLFVIHDSARITPHIRSILIISAVPVRPLVFVHSARTLALRTRHGCLRSSFTYRIPCSLGVLCSIYISPRFHHVVIVPVFRLKQISLRVP